jgi:tetratricopeptide (TPR) repeat protein
MTTDSPAFSETFQRVYCDPTVFASFSGFHPISFARVLPFQSQDAFVDDGQLLSAEESHLAERNDYTRRAVVDAFVTGGLLPHSEAENVNSIIDDFDNDFFELMGLVYGNAGMFICALRWYREAVQALETLPPDSCSGLNSEDVHASVGYCLYALGLYEESISWSKSCIGPRHISDALCQALIAYEAQIAGGRILSVEHAATRTRYTANASDTQYAIQITPRLKSALKELSPFQDTYLDWVSHGSPGPTPPPEAYPFRLELDGSGLPRHKLNLIFATCARADLLVEKGSTAEAKRLLTEAAILEPSAAIISDRLLALA